MSFEEFRGVLRGFGMFWEELEEIGVHGTSFDWLRELAYRRQSHTSHWMSIQGSIVRYVQH